MVRYLRGFTLVETMVVVAILGILLAIAAPSFQSYLVSNRIQAAAEVFSAAVMQAKAEAALRNANVELVLTPEGPSEVATAEPVAANVATSGWMIRPVDRSAYVDGKQFSEDSRGGVSVTGLATAAVTFNPLGQTTLGLLPTPIPVATFEFSSPGDGNCRPAGPVRCLRIQIKATGSSKVCIPTITQMSDPRACT